MWGHVAGHAVDIHEVDEDTILVEVDLSGTRAEGQLTFQLTTPNFAADNDLAWWIGIERPSDIRARPVFGRTNGLDRMVLAGTLRADSERVPSPSQRFGFARERRAEAFLEESGYRIEERNWRGAGGEIDLVAWEGEVLCFVEVRARSRDDFGFPEETVDRRKQRKLIRAALAYLMKFRPREMPMARFDVVAVLRDEITLFKNAFDCGRG